ncbi:extracellular solute-binding protein [Isoptericola cucumis]|uniref:extracellular solute-binding protein n=1 Tax=Isoptericola cucumis TaxID=1776856 RepID=UPI003208EF31
MDSTTIADRLRSSPLSRRAFLGALGLTALAGCSASVDAGGARAQAVFRPGEYRGPQVRLEFWNPFTGGDGPAMGGIVDQFNAAHPRIRVVMTSLPADSLYTKVVPAVGAGEGPDVAIMHLDQLATFAARGTLVPLDEVADGLELDGDDFVPAVWRNGVYDGRRLGIPLDVLTMGQYWNVPVLADAGVPGAIADGAEFGTTMAALQDAGIEHPFWVTPSWQMFASLLPQFGGRLFDETGTRAEIASPAAVTALEWMVEQISSGVSPAGATDPRPPLKNGSAAVLADLPATIPDLTLTAPDLEWGVAPFPRIGPEPGVFANSHHLVLTDQSQADEDVAHAAQTFVDWVSRHSEPWIASGNTPARATVRAGEAFRSSPQAALATEENFAAAVFLPQIPQSRVIAANSWQRAVGEAVLGGVDPTEALEFAQATAQEELDETNELLQS